MYFSKYFVFLVLFFQFTCFVYCKKVPDVKIEKLEGSGCKNGAKKGNKVLIHYTGYLKDGKVFDSSKGRDPLPFTLGQGKVVPGMEKGVFGMCIGEKRKITIPPELAYGETGVKDIIPPKATLVFDVELVEIEGKSSNIISLIAFLSIPFIVGGGGYYLYTEYTAKGKVSKKKAREEAKQNKKKK